MPKVGCRRTFPFSSRVKAKAKGCFISAVVFINFSTKSSGKNGVSAATEIKQSAFKFSAHRNPDKIPANGPKKPGIVSETIGSP